MARSVHGLLSFVYKWSTETLLLQVMFKSAGASLQSGRVLDNIARGLSRARPAPAVVRSARVFSQWSGAAGLRGATMMHIAD
jgi:hypothetical protein